MAATREHRRMGNGLSTFADNPGRSHWLDTLAPELAAYIDSMIEACVDDLTQGGVVPFAANVSQAETLAYYTRQFFDPDGTPNAQGRATEMARLGEVGFADALRAVLKAHPEYQAPQVTQPVPLMEGAV